MASKRILPILHRPLERIGPQTASSTSHRILRPIHASSTRQELMPRMRQPKRHFTTTLVTRKEQEEQKQQQSSSSTTAEIPPSKLYTFNEIQSLSQSPSSHRILIDVREPAELHATGTIPTSHNIPVGSSADAFFLPADEFEDKYGFPRPGKGDEVIFYCKAGVRSRAAARLAGQAGFGGTIGEFPGSWVEWVEKGGEKERVK